MSPQIDGRGNRKRIPKSTWMPCLLLIYLFGMTIWFAPSLIANGEIARLIIVFVSELAIIIALRIFLKKREEQKDR